MKKSKETVKQHAARLAAMNEEDFYNHVMGGTNRQGKERLGQMRAVFRRAAK